MLHRAGAQVHLGDHAANAPDRVARDRDAGHPHTSLFGHDPGDHGVEQRVALLGQVRTTRVTSPRPKVAQTRWSIQPPSSRGAPTPSSSIMAGMVHADRYEMMTEA
jgi:hypothetical protein